MSTLNSNARITLNSDWRTIRERSFVNGNYRLQIQARITSTSATGTTFRVRVRWISRSGWSIVDGINRDWNVNLNGSSAGSHRVMRRTTSLSGGQTVTSYNSSNVVVNHNQSNHDRSISVSVTGGGGSWAVVSGQSINLGTVTSGNIRLPARPTPAIAAQRSEFTSTGGFATNFLTGVTPLFGIRHRPGRNASGGTIQTFHMLQMRFSRNGTTSWSSWRNIGWDNGGNISTARRSNANDWRAMFSDADTREIGERMASETRVNVEARLRTYSAATGGTLIGTSPVRASHFNRPAGVTISNVSIPSIAHATTSFNVSFSNARPAFASRWGSPQFQSRVIIRRISGADIINLGNTANSGTATTARTISVNTAGVNGIRNYINSTQGINQRNIRIVFQTALVVGGGTIHNFANRSSSFDRMATLSGAAPLNAGTLSLSGTVLSGTNLIQGVSRVIATVPTPFATAQHGRTIRGHEVGIRGFTLNGGGDSGRTVTLDQIPTTTGIINVDLYAIDSSNIRSTRRTATMNVVAYNRPSIDTMTVNATGVVRVVGTWSNIVGNSMQGTSTTAHRFKIRNRVVGGVWSAWRSVSSNNPSASFTIDIAAPSGLDFQLDNEFQIQARDAFTTVVIERSVILQRQRPIMRLNRSGAGRVEVAELDVPIIRNDLGAIRLREGNNNFLREGHSGGAWWVAGTTNLIDGDSRAMIRQRIRHNTSEWNPIVSAGMQNASGGYDGTWSAGVLRQGAGSQFTIAFYRADRTANSTDAAMTYDSNRNLTGALIDAEAINRGTMHGDRIASGTLNANRLTGTIHADRLPNIPIARIPNIPNVNINNVGSGRASASGRWRVGNMMIVTGTWTFENMVANQVMSRRVAFGVTFLSNPNVQVTPQTGGVAVNWWATNNISLTHVDILVRRTNTTNTVVRWMAVGFV